MKKVALVFVLAVFVPSLVLAWLAIHSLRDQQLVLERQQSLLCQGLTDAFAKEINDYLAEQQREFNLLVESLVTNEHPRSMAAAFDERLREAWRLADVGFCVTLSGNLLCPSPATRPEARMFCVDNGGFLANRESVEVYWNDFSKTANLNSPRPQVQQLEAPQIASANQTLVSDQALAPLPAAQNNLKIQARKVNPAQQASLNAASSEPNYSQEQNFNFSKVVPTEAEFRQLIGDATDGMVARFLQNKLRLMFWHRLAKDPQLVFGAQLDLNRIIGMLRLMATSRTKSNEGYSQHNARNNPARAWSAIKSAATLPDDICLVVLDDNAKAVAASDTLLSGLLESAGGVRLKGGLDATFREQFKTDLKHPFVASEIGDALPHWEVAAYLRHPEKLKQSARTLQLTLGLLILVAVLAIGAGSWLIVHCLKQELKLARQKTDFVSNVSHELKTPLTSIRMFSELLAEGRVKDPSKQRSYFNIISSEAARLTRLINNVLDFSRLERGDKKYNFAVCDLVEIARDTAETYRPHLENNGVTLDCQLPSAPLPVRADGDALSQVIVNLLSNAEKYSNGQKQITMQVARADGSAAGAEVRILDRGLGVPHGCEEKIFEQFYRAHDSLSNGIQGSGLGLTLARQIARVHGGDVVYQPREGGGSCFTLRLPLTPSPSPSDEERH